jgi:hypothetical protein
MIDNRDLPSSIIPMQMLNIPFSALSKFLLLRLAALPLVFAMLAGHGVRAGEMPPPKIWLNHFKLGSLADARDEGWPVTREGLDTAFFGINTLWPLKWPLPLSIPPETAAKTAAKLHANGIRIGVECGYFDHRARLTEPDNPASTVVPEHELPLLAPGIGEHTARVEIAKLRPIWQAGHPPDFIMLDDPMRRLTVPGQDSLGQLFTGMADYPTAAREVVAYMHTMRQQFPKVKFVTIINFPNWGWKGQPAFLVPPGRTTPLNWGDAYDAMETLFAVVTEAGLDIHAIQADFPWRYYNQKPANAIAATIDWPQRLLSLERYARVKGVGFNLVVNSETGYLSAEAFAKDTLQYLDAYLADGGRPDHFVVQSWYPHPEQLLPESEPDACAWLCARFIERLRAIHAGSPPKPSTPQPTPLDRAEPEVLLQMLEFLDPPTHQRLAPQVNERWLNHHEDPPVALAAEELMGLRTAVSQAAAGKPRATVVIGDQELRPARGLKPLPPPATGQTAKWLVEVASTASASKLLTVWVDGSTSKPMSPVWVARGMSSLLAVEVDPALVKDGAVTLCLGETGKEPQKVAIPVGEAAIGN